VQHSLSIAYATYFEELLTQIEVDAKLFKETTLTKQARARSHRIREGNVQSYGAQSTHDKIDAMEIRDFLCARDSLEGQLGSCFNLNAEHSTDIRMEQADIRAGINQ